MKQIFVIGAATFNTLIYVAQFPDPRPHTVFSKGLHETVGGTGAGKALNLNRLGFQVTFHSMVGDDAAGQAVRRYLDEAGLQSIHDLDPAGTERHVNLMDDEGRRISIYVVYGTFAPAVNWSPIEAAIVSSDLVALNISNYCRGAIPLARQYGKPIWCDIHDYDGENNYHTEFIEAADVLFMSSDSMPRYRDFMQAQIDAGKSLVICTHGKDGATALANAGEWITVPALTSYGKKDTNGAGDSFFAGFLYAHTQGYAVEKCLQMGTIVGGLCITASELVYPDLSVALLESEYQRHYG